MKDTDQLVQYWLTVAKHDYKTMLVLYQAKRYSDCLFFGHLTLEKILKALVVFKNKDQAPYTHDLLRLATSLKNIKLTGEETNLLDDVNRFNIRTRYPDYRLKFYKICTPDYTKDYLTKIKKLFKKLCQKLPPEKSSKSTVKL